MTNLPESYPKALSILQIRPGVRFDLQLPLRMKIQAQKLTVIEREYNYTYTRHIIGSGGYVVLQVAPPTEPYFKLGSCLHYEIYKYYTNLGQVKFITLTKKGNVKTRYKLQAAAYLFSVQQSIKERLA